MGLVEFGKVWWGLVEFCGIWWNLVGFGRVWWGLVGSGRVWWGLVGFMGFGRHVDSHMHILTTLLRTDRHTH